MEEDDQVLISVSEQWFRSLLDDALDFEEAQKSWEYGNPVNDKIHFKAVTLMGYAKSAKYILETNKSKTKKL